MGVEKTFRTFHFGCASVLHFCLGGDSHINTRVLPGTKRIAYEFLNNDEGICEQLAKAFFDTENPMAIGDARALIESSRFIKKSMTQAIRAEDGVWTNQEAECPTT